MITNQKINRIIQEQKEKEKKRWERWKWVPYFGPEILVLFLTCYLALAENAWSTTALCTFLCYTFITAAVSKDFEDKFQNKSSLLGKALLSTFLIAIDFVITMLLWASASSLKAYTSSVKYVLWHDGVAYIEVMKELTGSDIEAAASLEALNTSLSTLEHSIGPFLGTLGFNPAEFFLLSLLVMTALKLAGFVYFFRKEKKYE